MWKVASKCKGYKILGFLWTVKKVKNHLQYEIPFHTFGNPGPYTELLQRMRHPDTDQDHPGQNHIEFHPQMSNVQPKRLV